MARSSLEPVLLLGSLTAGALTEAGPGAKSSSSSSVEEPATPLGAAVAGQLAAGVLHGELVVVGELLAGADAARGQDDDVLPAIHGDHARVAVGLTGVVDEASGVAVHRGVHHLVVVDAEHVAAHALQREE